MEEVSHQRAGRFQLKALATILLIAMYAFGLGGCLDAQIEQLRARELTDLHGEEVTATIQRYERAWLSQDVGRNPALRDDLATAQWADYMGVHVPSLGGLVTTAATVTDVSVIEYDSMRFKAWACTTNTFEELTLQGAFVRSGKISRCGTYVFWKLDDKWKLAGYFNDGDRRYYNQSPLWLQQVIGDLPKN